MIPERMLITDSLKYSLVGGGVRLQAQYNRERKKFIKIMGMKDETSSKE
jgi:hypothetical protein